VNCDNSIALTYGLWPNACKETNQSKGYIVPGAYAHITLINLAREPARLESGSGIHNLAALALGRWLKYCELGAVSPDYPYLAVGFKGAAEWADQMHYQHTGDMVKAGVAAVKKLSGNVRDKAFAWLLGYAAHVITDATIHPVIQLKVGPYAQNKMAHRRCEMHQDSYIFQRLDMGGIGVAEYLRTGIDECCVAEGALDPAIADTWRQMLQSCYSSKFLANPPEIERWHAAYTKVLEVGGDGYHLLPLSRHVAVDCGLTYPLLKDVNRKAYIDCLKTPSGSMSYDQIFDKALAHVVRGWQLIGDAVFGDSPLYLTAFWNWDLDTGMDANKKMVLWEGNTL
jgi:hypothetical protein